MTNLYAVHFGIVPVAGPVLLNGAAPRDHAVVLLESASAYRIAAVVDGTWEEWGESVETGDSIHLNAYSLTADWLARDEVAQMHASLVGATSGRVLDYAVVTTHEDDSVKVGLFTFDCNRVYTYTATAGLRLDDFTL